MGTTIRIAHLPMEKQDGPYMRIIKGRDNIHLPATSTAVSRGIPAAMAARGHTYACIHTYASKMASIIFMFHFFPDVNISTDGCVCDPHTISPALPSSRQRSAGRSPPSLYDIVDDPQLFYICSRPLFVPERRAPLDIV